MAVYLNVRLSLSLKNVKIALNNYFINTNKETTCAVTDRQIDKQTDRQIDRQTDRHTDRQTEGITVV